MTKHFRDKSLVTGSLCWCIVCVVSARGYLNVWCQWRATTTTGAAVSGKRGHPRDFGTEWRNRRRPAVFTVVLVGTHKLRALLCMLVFCPNVDVVFFFS